MAYSENHRKAVARWRVKNRARVNAYNKEWRRKTTRILDALKSAMGCIDCRITDPLVLDFDHRDRSAKIANVSRLAANTSNMGKIMAEVAKCDVRCANCHRRKTAIDLGWRE